MLHCAWCLIHSTVSQLTYLLLIMRLNFVFDSRFLLTLMLYTGASWEISKILIIVVFWLYVTCLRRGDWGVTATAGSNGAVARTQQPISWINVYVYVRHFQYVAWMTCTITSSSLHVSGQLLMLTARWHCNCKAYFNNNNFSWSDWMLLCCLYIKLQTNQGSQIGKAKNGIFLSLGFELFFSEKCQN